VHDARASESLQLTTSASPRRAVLDFSLLNWLDSSQVAYPTIFDSLKSGTNDSFTGRDITSLMVNSGQRDVAECLVDTIRVGFVDSVTFGCVASDVVLYVSLVVIIGVVLLRFLMAVMFGWFLSWKIGKFPDETYEQRRARAAEIENWTDDIYRPAPARYRPSVPKSQQGGAGGGAGGPNKLQKKSVLPTTSRYSKTDLLKAGGTSGGGGKGADGSLSRKGMLGAGMRNSPPGSPGTPRASRSSTSLPMSSFTLDGLAARGNGGTSASEGAMGACPFPLGDVVAQPSADFEPFNYPLAHALLLVTAYSESVEGLRTTLDSLSTTDYPNSHKTILVIADGMVKGSGNELTTPEIVLGMMKEFVVAPAEVESYSYVAIADGHKRHNMAKVYAGFYAYDDNTVERSKQQRVPMLLVAKVGNPAEAHDAKPGNRGKRDSQIVLMSFLQKVMFDERMTTFEYEFFNSLWRATGVSPDKYELVLMVDADTKVFPDSVSRMTACMVNDPEIMGLCGETKIANKSDSWVTMIQVFECVPLPLASSLPRPSPRLVVPSLTLVVALQVLRVAPPDQGVRVDVRRRHVLARVLLDVPHQGAQGRRWLLGPDPRQPRHRPALLGERRRHAAQEEPAPPRRGPVPVDPHAAHVPPPQDDVLPASRLQDDRPRHVLDPPVAAPSLDQLDRPQPVRAHRRPRPVRRLLLQHALRQCVTLPPSLPLVFSETSGAAYGTSSADARTASPSHSLHGARRHPRPPRRHRLHALPHRRRHHPRHRQACRLARPARPHPRYPGHPHRRHLAPLRASPSLPLASCSSEILTLSTLSFHRPTSAGCSSTCVTSFPSSLTQPVSPADVSLLLQLVSLPVWNFILPVYAFTHFDDVRLAPLLLHSLLVDVADALIHSRSFPGARHVKSRARRASTTIAPRRATSTRRTSP